MASWIYSDEQLRIVIEADAAAKVEISLWSCFATDRKMPCSLIEVKCHLAGLKDCVLVINRLPYSQTVCDSESSTQDILPIYKIIK